MTSGADDVIPIRQEVVEAVFKNYDPALKVASYSVDNGSNAGDNYMSAMYQVNIDVTNTNNNTDLDLAKEGPNKTYSIMLKRTPLNPARETFINDIQAFGKEITMYGKVFPSFEELQKQLGFGADKIYKDYPNCLATFKLGKVDYLALENLKPLGYKLADRLEGLDKEHCSLVLKRLARFHALSYAKFQGDHEAIVKAYPELPEKMYVHKDTMIDMVKFFIISSLEANQRSLRAKGYGTEATILDHPEFQPDAVIEKLSNSLCKPVKYAVIGHGDLWTNNILFKYDDESTGKPIDLKFVDYQLSIPCSRAIDLHYFMFSSPKDEFIDCEEEFLKIYYEEFVIASNELGFFQEECTFDQLQVEFNEFRWYRVIISFLMFQFFFALKNDAMKVDEMDENVSADSVGDTFGGMRNDLIIKKLVKVINFHVPKLNL